MRNSGRRSRGAYVRGAAYQERNSAAHTRSGRARGQEDTRKRQRQVQSVQFGRERRQIQRAGIRRARFGKIPLLLGYKLVEGAGACHPHGRTGQDVPLFELCGKRAERVARFGVKGGNSSAA